MSPLRRHPTEERLSLFAGGELGWFWRWRTARHAANCRTCEVAIENFRRLRAELGQAQPAPRVDFGALAQRINVAAEQASSHGRPRPARRWKVAAASGLAAAAATLALLLLPGENSPASPERAKAVQPVPAMDVPLDVHDGLEAQITSDGRLRVRSFQAGSGQLAITDYYAP